MVDAGDLKSPGRKAVPVRVRPRALVFAPGENDRAVRPAGLVDVPGGGQMSWGRRSLVRPGSAPPDAAGQGSEPPLEAGGFGCKCNLVSLCNILTFYSNDRATHSNERVERFLAAVRGHLSLVACWVALITQIAVSQLSRSDSPQTLKNLEQPATCLPSASIDARRRSERAVRPRHTAVRPKEIP